MTPRLYTHPIFLKHDTGPGHPERPERLRVLLDLFREEPFALWPLIQAEAADMAYILTAHDADYLERLEMQLPERGLGWFDADTAMSPATIDAALHAAGAVRRAVDDIVPMAGGRAFCAVRPPGHHAMPPCAMGFCFFNNVFLGALHAREAHGLQRVAIVDFDVHWGNGSEAMARQHEGVLFLSSHQWPLYTLVGSPGEDSPGRVMNVPLTAGDGSFEFRRAWRERLLPELEAFAPELIMISAGFDAHERDPLAQLRLQDDDFGWITAEIVRVANRHAGGRIVSVLEGGYDLPALTSGVAAHLLALAD